MAELHSNLYFRHPNSSIMDNLKSFFYDCNGDQEKLISIATAINPEKGKELVHSIIDSVVKPEHDLNAESIMLHDEYISLHFVHGGMGDEYMENIVHFVYRLVPDIHAQAWGQGDDDPWEFWIKFENGKITRRDDEPLMDEEEDDEIKSTIYEWWHKDMPDDIKEGMLNEATGEIDLEDKYMVFTGKMSQGNREEMEELAEEYGANIQKSINKKTNILVVGERAGASKLNKAEELGVKVITEKEFYDSVDAEENEEEEDYPPLIQVEGFESLSDLKIEKVSQLLNHMTKDSFFNIPFSQFYSLVEKGVKAEFASKEKNALVNSYGGWVDLRLYLQADNEAVDVNIEGMASALLKLGIISDDKFNEMVKSKHIYGIRCYWKGDKFNAEFGISISDESSYPENIFMVNLEIRFM